MAGHSQFKNIMYRKGAQDKKRSKQFAKLSKEISVATKEGGADPDANPRLRLAIQNARSNNMPKDNIERAISKGKSSDNDGFIELRYEGYGPGGIAILVETLTDNRNRTAGNLRALFSKNGGTLGENGSVAFMFDRVGEIVYPANAAEEQDIIDFAIEAGADDVEFGEHEHTIICDFTATGEVYDKIKELIGEARTVNIVWRPQNMIPLTEDNAITLFKLISALDDDDDVQNVYANFTVADDIMTKLSGDG